MIVDKELHISNRKKADIVQDLRKLSFRAFPKVLKIRKSGEKEPINDELETRAAVESEEAETGASSDYDYLLGMPIWSLTEEKVVIFFIALVSPFMPSRSQGCALKLKQKRRNCKNCWKRRQCKCGLKIWMIYLKHGRYDLS
jgi:hypothetical protein